MDLDLKTNAKGLKQELLKNHNNAISIAFINYKNHYYSLNKFVKKIKKEVRYQDIKDFNMLGFLEHFFKRTTLQTDDNLNYYFYNLMVNKNMRNMVRDFSIYGDKTNIQTTYYLDFLSTDKGVSGWGSVIKMDFAEAREYFKKEYDIDDDIVSLVEFKDKIIFKTKKNTIIEKIK